MKIWFEDRRYYMRLRLIRFMAWLRPIVGRISASRPIFGTTEMGWNVIKIRPWLLKATKCVTADDVYVVTGIYGALIKPEICKGYENLGISNDTYKFIEAILLKNYKWNEETMFGSRNDAIRFSWMNYSPVSIDIDDWYLEWDEHGVKERWSNGQNN